MAWQNEQGIDIANNVSLNTGVLAESVTDGNR